MGLSINDSVYSCLFFFLTGLHFFHLLVGLLLCCLLFWSCSFSIFIFFLHYLSYLYVLIFLSLFVYILILLFFVLFFSFFYLFGILSFSFLKMKNQEPLGNNYNVVTPPSKKYQNLERHASSILGFNEYDSRRATRNNTNE